ncbi:MAG: right-handed parallel beta-helix repeat-containing protein [Parvularculaceae bacterium]
MKRVLTFLAAASSLGVGVANTASAQSLGGFPIREPGASRPVGEGPSTGSPGASNRNEVVVSQDAGSRVTTIAQAMRLVRPGGTILVKGGVYNENIVVTKPVEIRGVVGDYGRNAVIRPASNAPCVSIAPDSALASVSLSQLIFEFDDRIASGTCVDIQGGTVSVSDSFIIPVNSDIPLRAAYGPLGGALRPELTDHLARPPRDRNDRLSDDAARLEGYVRRHAQPVGAENKGWTLASGSGGIDQFVHSRGARGVGLLTGPASGIRVTAGDVRLDGNVIIGTRTAVNFASGNNAIIKGSLTNNVVIGNGTGIAATGIAADLLLTRNTIRYNAGPGVTADVYDGVKIIANEITGNETGIYLSERVRSASVNSNLVAQNFVDAMRVSSGFFGAVGGNTFAENGGCTIQFFSAEQKIINNADIKVTAFRDFDPVVAYENTNYAVGNSGDAKMKKRKKSRRDSDANREASVQLASCNAPL